MAPIAALASSPSPAAMAQRHAAVPLDGLLQVRVVLAVLLDVEPELLAQHDRERVHQPQQHRVVRGLGDGEVEARRRPR